MLYWPEKRGIYGKVEVLVNSVQECENYTVRNLTLKVIREVTIAVCISWKQRQRIKNQIWWLMWNSLPPEDKHLTAIRKIIQIMNRAINQTAERT